MQHITEEESNPFGFRPDCDRFVPGFGDVNADFHVLGDHPGVHGGIDSGIPFTENEGGMALQRVLSRAGLLDAPGNPPVVNGTYLSYLNLCVTDGNPTEREYSRNAIFAESEIRAITAHVLLPVGERPIRWVLERMSTHPSDDVDVSALHGQEIVTGGWLVYPIADPASWTDSEADVLEDALIELQTRDFRREADLGRLAGGNDAYLVR